MPHCLIFSSNYGCRKLLLLTLIKKGKLWHENECPRLRFLDSRESGITLVCSAAILYYFKWNFIWAYICGINLAVFLLYGYDKRAAQQERALRVPEMVLHLFTFMGGTPLAYLGQLAFRHKTIKGSFRIVFWSIFLLQIGLVLAFLAVFTREIEIHNAKPHHDHSQRKWAKNITG